MPFSNDMVPCTEIFQTSLLSHSSLREVESIHRRGTKFPFLTLIRHKHLLRDAPLSELVFLENKEVVASASADCDHREANEHPSVNKPT